MIYLNSWLQFKRTAVCYGVPTHIALEEALTGWMIKHPRIRHIGTWEKRETEKRSCRNRIIVHRVLSGETYIGVGKCYRITPVSVRSIVRRSCRISNSSEFLNCATIKELRKSKDLFI